jgi:tripeptidyl-peptidase-1
VPPGQGAYILEWALQVANLTDADAPKVTSISYGDTEIGFYNKFGDFSYVERMEVELAKMAVRGLTVVAGSGDAGASNVGEAGNDVSPTDPTCAPFRAFYPSSSPYVLSLSSTFLTTAYLPVCEQSMGPLPVQCTQVGERSVSLRDGLYWTTGGGFSNRTNNPTAKYQQRQVQNYLSTAAASGLLPPTAGGVWNAGGRGYPDIATLGHNLLFVFGGALGTVDGTSASGPVAAGLLTLINDALLNADLPTLGLVNPMLYALQAENPYAFNDVVMGSNFDGDWQPSCGAAYPSLCPYGFTTQPGWDPVSGLGTPNFPVIRDAALELLRAKVEARKQLQK